MGRRQGQAGHRRPHLPPPPGADRPRPDRLPTIVWDETDYSVYVVRQASRRSWRIGQTRPVKVVFMSYRNTLQADALKLVAKKMQSSLAVEGSCRRTGLPPMGRRRRHDDGLGPQDRQRRGGGRRHGDDGGGVRPGQERRERGRGAAGGRRLEGRRSGAEAIAVNGNGYHDDLLGPTVELVPANGHANGNGANGHHDEAPEPQQSLFSWAEFMAEEPVKPKGRKTQAPSLSLFEWAVEQERAAQPVGLSA